MATTPTYDVIVVGAGIVGASIAWHASKNGLRTAVLDASGPAAGASGASDGAVSVSSKKPGTMMELATDSLLYCSELAREGVLRSAFRKRPTFFFASTEEEAAALDRLRSALGEAGPAVSVVRDGSPDTSAIAGIGGAVARVVELTGEGHMLGYEATAAFLADSRADRLWPCRFHGYEASGNDLRVSTDLGGFEARQLVFATGVGTAQIFPEIPIIPRSGQLIITDRTTGSGWHDLPGCLTSAAYLLSKSDKPRPLGTAPVVIDPVHTGQLLIGSSREDHGSVSQTDFATVRQILQSAVACLPALAQRRVIRVFAGLRAATGDGYPVVGTVARAPNVYLASGFEGDGICLAPLIGREMAKLLSGQPALAALDRLSPRRFAKAEASAR